MNIFKYIPMSILIGALLGLIFGGLSYSQSKVSSEFVSMFFVFILISWFVGWVVNGTKSSINTRNKIKFKIIEGYKKQTFAYIYPGKGIFFNNQYYWPLGIDNIQSLSTKDTSGTLGGAALGGIAFGEAGAVIGAIAGGNKSEVNFTLDLKNKGKVIACVQTKLYPYLLAEIENLKNFNNPAYQVQNNTVPTDMDELIQKMQTAYKKR